MNLNIESSDETDIIVDTVPERATYNDKGKLDEVFTTGSAHLERLSKKNWFLSCERADGSSLAVWFEGMITMTEERPAPDRALAQKDSTR
ncbi:hypothetical protein JJJ17_04095 [Paracoccus caeni]|uniref:Uncharacterized protein n=1 Tax=Paracoccus caeni TaxID=657651 RepID=A0A934VXL7_9RHOB|nr:hypothetical protein [Paracoccus caeni]MBK4215102.1 hypothetical protein [Paracoccus caeni]